MAPWVIRAIPAGTTCVVAVAVLALARRAQKEGTVACAAGVLGLLVALLPAALVAGGFWSGRSFLPRPLHHVLYETQARRMVDALTSPRMPDVLLVWAGLTAAGGALALKWRRSAPQRILGIASICLALPVVPLAFVPSIVHGLVLRQCVEDSHAKVLASPASATARSGYAAWLVEAGEYDKALAEARRARELDASGNPSYALEEGAILLRLGKPREALQPLRAAYERRHWYDDQGAQAAAQFERMAGEGGELPPPLREAVRSRRHVYEDLHVEASTTYVACLTLLGRWEHAAEVIREVQARFPDRWDTRWVLALFRRALRREQELRDQVHDIRRTHPQVAAEYDERLGKLPQPSDAQRELLEWANRYTDGP